MSFRDLFRQGDAVTQVVAILLLVMSISSWVVILCKIWMLQRAGRDVARSTAAFWQAGSLAEGRQRVAAFDREALVLPLIVASEEDRPGSEERRLRSGAGHRRRSPMMPDGSSAAPACYPGCASRENGR